MLLVALPMVSISHSFCDLFSDHFPDVMCSKLKIPNHIFFVILRYIYFKISLNTSYAGPPVFVGVKNYVPFTADALSMPDICRS